VSRDQRLGGDGDGRQRELLPGTPPARRFALIALVFLYEARDPEEFETAYGPAGEWARFFAGARGYIGTELLRDLEVPTRYAVIDRWETADTYNEFLASHQAEYLRLSDELAFYYVQELRYGTFESVG
jgi:heme-degrading monooxygenase HmoA